MLQANGCNYFATEDTELDAFLGFVILFQGNNIHVDDLENFLFH